MRIVLCASFVMLVLYMQVLLSFVSQTILQTGYGGRKVTIADKPEIVSVLKYHCLKITTTEMDQFMEGLESLGILSYMKKCPI